MTDTIHTFEAAGLGKPPFKLLGVTDSDSLNSNGMVKLANGCETKLGGTCAYCGRAITVLCRLVSADGKKFHVGSECVEKAGDAGIKRVVKVQIAKRNTEKRHAREADKIDFIKAQLADETIRQQLAAKPHPQSWAADKGMTLLDWAEWMMKHSGNAGKLKVGKAIKTNLK